MGHSNRESKGLKKKNNPNKKTKQTNTRPTPEKTNKKPQQIPGKEYQQKQYLKTPIPKINGVEMLHTSQAISHGKSSGVSR